MFEVGKTYQSICGLPVKIAGKSNEGTNYETVFSIENGKEVHRYNARDFGRVTGTSHAKPDPRNLLLIAGDQKDRNSISH